MEEPKQVNLGSKQERFEKNIKPILYYVGTIGAVLTAIAYIAIVFIMVFGFAATATLGQSIVFACINALIGMIIMQLLKIQGIDFAKNLECNKTIIQKYNKLKAKTKKARSIKFFWATSMAKDALIKGLTTAATTLGIIYIIIQASNNYTLLLLAIVNLIMFACFGLMSLVKAYDFFNDEHIPYLEEKLNEFEAEEKERAAALELQEQNRLLEEARAREQIIETEVQRRVDLVKKEFIEQGNNNLYTNRGIDILDTSVDTCDHGNNNRSELLENCDNGNCVLEHATDTRSTNSNRLYFGNEESFQINKISEENK